MFHQDKLKKINDSSVKTHISITGGGTSFIGDFLSGGGGSETVLECLVPYSQERLVEFIGFTPEKFCSSDTARQMAMKSFLIAKSISGIDGVGIGCTASLVKQNQRKERKNKFYVALQTYKLTLTIEVFVSNDLNRETQEILVSDLILAVLLDVCGEKQNYKHILRGCEFQISRIDPLKKPHENMPPFGIVELFNGDNSFFPNTITPIELLEEGDPVIFPGAFNPIHEGHREIYDMAKKITGKTPILELSIENVDKPLMNYHDIFNRYKNIGNRFPSIMTRMPRFTDKFIGIRKIVKELSGISTSESLKQKITFIVGADTWKRILNVKYAERDDVRNHVSFLDNAHFIVFNRGEVEKNLKSNIKNVIFVNGFDNPMSSTKLRNAH